MGGGVSGLRAGAGGRSAGAGGSSAGGGVLSAGRWGSCRGGDTTTGVGVRTGGGGSMSASSRRRGAGRGRARAAAWASAPAPIVRSAASSNARASSIMPPNRCSGCLASARWRTPCNGRGSHPAGRNSDRAGGSSCTTWYSTAAVSSPWNGS